MGIKDNLKRAIDSRNTVSFDYKGHSRIVEPYHYGVPIHQYPIFNDCA
jgi:hypothetical protein